MMSFGFNFLKQTLKETVLLKVFRKLKVLKILFSNCTDPVGNYGFPFALVSRRYTCLFCNSCPTLQ